MEVENNEEKTDFINKIDNKVNVGAINLAVPNEVEEIVGAEEPSLKADNRDKLLTNQNNPFHVMDKVKIVLISEELDSETHNYRKYYEPHLIGKVGEISDILVSSTGKKTYEVDVYGQKSIFEEAELLWIG